MVNRNYEPTGRIALSTTVSPNFAITFDEMMEDEGFRSRSQYLQFLIKERMVQKGRRTPTT